MSVICEFELSSPDLPLCSVAAKLDTILTVDNVISWTRSEPALVFSTTGVDPDELEAALDEAHPVVEYVAMDSTVVESRYRIVLDTDHVETYAELVERQTYPMGALVTEHGWKVSTQFADQTDLKTFRDVCEDDGIEFRPRRLFESGVGAADDGLTASQQEALLTAYQMGYFEIPRSTDLSGLADELDTTTSALSERLRRGHQNLIEHTIASTEI